MYSNYYLRSINGTTNVNRLHLTVGKDWAGATADVEVNGTFYATDGIRFANSLSAPLQTTPYPGGAITNVTLDGQVLTFTQDGESDIVMTIPSGGGASLVAQTTHKPNPNSVDVYAASYLNDAFQTGSVVISKNSGTEAIPALLLVDENTTQTAPYYAARISARARSSAHENAIYYRIHDTSNLKWGTWDIWANGGPVMIVGRDSSTNPTNVTVNGYFRATHGIRFGTDTSDANAANLQTVAYPGGACTGVNLAGVRSNTLQFTFDGQSVTTDITIDTSNLPNYVSGVIGTNPDWVKNSLAVAGTQSGSGILYIGPNSSQSHGEELMFRTNKNGLGSTIGQVTYQARDFTNQTLFNYGYDQTFIGNGTSAQYPFGHKDFRLSQGSTGSTKLCLRVGKNYTTDATAVVYGMLDVGDTSATETAYLRLRSSITAINTLQSQISFDGGYTGGVQSVTRYGAIESYAANTAAGSIQGYVMHRATHNNVDTIVMQVGNSNSTATPSVRVFGDCLATKFYSNSGLENQAQTSQNHAGIMTITSHALDTASNMARYSDITAVIGESTAGSLYGYTYHGCLQDGVQKNLLRVGRPDGTTSYHEDVLVDGILGATTVNAVNDFVVRNLGTLTNTTIGALKWNASGTNPLGVTEPDKTYAQIVGKATTQPNGSYGKMTHEVTVNGDPLGVLDVGYPDHGGYMLAGVAGVGVTVHGKLQANTIRFDDGTEMSTAPSAPMQLTPIAHSLRGATNRMNTIGTLTGSHTTGATSGTYAPTKMWDQVLGEQQLAGWGTAPIAFMFAAGSGPYAVNEFTIWCVPVSSGHYLDSLRNTVLKIYGSNDATIATDGTWHDLNQHVNIGGIAGASPDTNKSPWIVDAEACKSYTETGGQPAVQGWVFRTSSNMANYACYKLQCVGGTGFDVNYELGGITLDYKKRYELDYV